MDTPTIESKPSDQPWIANFWRRFSAFFIDGLLIALVGYGISQLMVPVFSRKPWVGSLHWLSYRTSFEHHF